MDQGNTVVIASGDAYAAALEKKQFPLKRVLVIAGIVAVLVIGAVIGIIIVRNLGAVEKDVAATALEDSVESVIFLDDRVAMVRNNDIAVSDLFMGDALAALTEQVNVLEGACKTLCDVSYVRSATNEENEQFAVVQTGLKERNDIYRKYFVDNFGAFYDAFAKGFQTVGSASYERNGKASELMASSNSNTAEVAKKLDSYLSNMSEATVEMNRLKCAVGQNRTECSVLESNRREYESTISDRDLTKKIVFGSDGTETALSENLLGLKMSLLAQSLRLENSQ